MSRTAALPFVLLLLLGCASTREREDEKPKEGGLPAGVVFRWQQRLSEDGTIPDGALLAAKAHRDRMVAAQEVGAGVVGPDGLPLSQSWTWLGPGNVGGRIRAILIHPTQPDVMWIGAVSGGVWKTVNGGGTWTPLDDFMPSLAIGCMVLQPGNPDILWAGTGEGFFNAVQGSSNTAAIQGVGILKSTDGGATWAHVASTTGPDWNFVNRIAISPTNGQVILAATGTGIFRSLDGGLSWTQTAAGRFLDVRFHPTDGQKAVAGSLPGAAWYSTNGGASWQMASGIANEVRVEVAYARSNPSTVYAAVAGTNERIRIWRSTDGGQSYTLQTANTGITTYDAYNTALWVDPTNPSLVVFGGVSLYRSNDSGVTYGGINNSLHPDHHILVEHPQYDGTTNRIVFSGNDGGIHKAVNIAASSFTWQELNNNLGITQFYGGAISPTGVLIGGAQDNGTLRTAGGTENWTATFGGDGGFCAADPTDPNYLYGEIYYLRIFRSTNAGVSASYIYNGITEPTSNFISHFVLDPNNPNRMLGGGAALWRSENVKAGTPTWAVIKPALACIPGPAGAGAGGGGLLASHFDGNPPCNISTVTVAEGNPDLIWVGHNNGEVYKTVNGTAAQPTWVRMDENPTALPNRWISRIAIHPADHNRVYVSVMGYTSDNLWRTLDGGLTWTQITGSGLTALPSAPVSCIAVHKTEAGWLYAATDIGLFTSVDDGANWSAPTEGPALVPVDELVWKNVRDLLAVTHGRGMFLGRTFPDCNDNFIPDSEDIASSTSQDCNGNSIPDECDIASATSADLNGNGIPDDCEAASVSPAGGGCGVVSSPILSAAPPAIGASQLYSLAGAPPSAAAWLVASLGPPLPWTVGSCVVVVDPSIPPAILPMGTTSSAGSAALSVPIPFSFTLIGAVATAQALVAAPGGPLLSAYTLSNGVSMTVGF